MHKGYFSEPVVESKDGFGDWMRHLPQPADDVSIITTIETICQQIELHVDNLYFNTERPLDSISERARAFLTEIDTGLVRRPLPEAMMRYRCKTTLIKQALAHMIFSNITIEDGSPGSLLPQDVAELQKSLQSATRYRNRPGEFYPRFITRIYQSDLQQLRKLSPTHASWSATCVKPLMMTQICSLNAIAQSRPWQPHFVLHSSLGRPKARVLMLGIPILLRSCVEQLLVVFCCSHNAPLSNLTGTWEIIGP